MIVPILCNICEQYIFAVDADILDFPFHSDMFTIPLDAQYSRSWQFPKGPVHMDLICPACNEFPLRWGDGRTGMSPFLKIRSESDPRMAMLISVEDLKARFAGDGIYVEPKLLKPIQEPRKLRPVLTPIQKARVDKNTSRVVAQEMENILQKIKSQKEAR